MLHKVEQNVKRVKEFVGAGKKIAGSVIRGIGIGGSAGFGITGKGVTVLAFKKLVLKIMGYSLGNLGPALLSLKSEGIVNRAVFCAENGICALKVLFFAHINFKPAFMGGKGVFFTDFCIFKNLFFH